MDFKLIRSTPKSKNDSFEALSIQLFQTCCNVPITSRFFSLRGNGGDGGVEAYYCTDSNDIYGVQAKYFFKLGSSEFNQIKKSLQTALDNYPNLVEYWIYIPFDLTGKVAQGKRGLSEIEKFEKWRNEKEKEHKKLSIILKSETEIRSTLLAIDTSGGYVTYWFNEDVLTLNKIKNCINAAEAFAGPRYCSDLDIITEAHDALDAFGEIYDHRNWINDVWKPAVLQFRRQAQGVDKIFSAIAEDDKTNALAILNNLLDKISCKSNILDKKIHFSTLNSITALQPHCEQAEKLQKEKFDSQHGEENDTPGFRQFHCEYQCSFPAEDLDRSREFLVHIEKIKCILNSPLILAYHAQSLLLTGPAGAGKTHSLVSFAKRRFKKGGSSIVLFGEDFDNYEIWDVLRSKLGFGSDIGREKLLGCLQASAHAAKKPFIIVIDALNESPKAWKWKNKLPEFIQYCKDYDQIKIAVSTRDVYTNLVVDERFPGYAYEHIGFTRNFHDVLESFSKRYQIPAEISPIFAEELRNPLFLHLIFKTSKATETSCIDVSSEGFATIFYKYLTHINSKLKERLGYANPKNIVKAAMLTISHSLATSSGQTLCWEEAVSDLKPILGSELSPEKFISELINEQLLILSTTGDDEYKLRLGFQRFGDTLRATSLVQASKKEGQNPLLTLSKKISIFSNKDRGVLEALACILPEDHAIEITDPSLNIAPDDAYKLFLNSLVWRSKQSITFAIDEYLYGALFTPNLWETVYETLFKLFLVPDHYLNVENWFSYFQNRQDVPTRDSYFSVAATNSYDKKGAIWFLLELTKKVNLASWPKESYRLAAISLLWCCSATDRRVRDQATRNLTLLFYHFPKLSKATVEFFSDCDDDYITESLIQAMYSACLLKNSNDAAFTYSLKNFIYNNRNSTNALIRDHAIMMRRFLEFHGADFSTSTTEFVIPELPNNWLTTQDLQKLLSLEHLPTNMKLWGHGMSPDFWRYKVQPRLRNFDLSSLGITHENIACWIMNDALQQGYPGYRESALMHDCATLYKYGSGRAKPRYAETTGKKCYWIAFHRLIGLLSKTIPTSKSSCKYFSLSLRKADVSDIRDIHSSNGYPISLVVPLHKVHFYDKVKNWPKKENSQPCDVIINKDVNGISWIALSVHSEEVIREDEDDFSFGAKKFISIDSYTAYIVDEQYVSSFTPPPYTEHHCYQSYLAEYPYSPTFDQCVEDQELLITHDRCKLSYITLLRGLEWEYDFSCTVEQENVHMPCPDIIKAMKLHWDHNTGWLEKNGQLAAFSHSLHRNQVLYIRKDLLDNYLDKSGNRLILNHFSRKHITQGFGDNSDLIETENLYLYQIDNQLSLLSRLDNN